MTRTNRNVPNRYPLRHPRSINEKSKLSEILNDPDVMELPIDKLSRMKTRLGRGGSLPDPWDDYVISAYYEIFAKKGSNMNTKKNMNDLICEAMDIVEWEFSKIRSRKELKKAVKLLKKQVEVNSNN